MTNFPAMDGFIATIWAIQPICLLWTTINHYINIVLISIYKKKKKRYTVNNIKISNNKKNK